MQILYFICSWANNWFIFSLGLLPLCFSVMRFLQFYIWLLMPEFRLWVIMTRAYFINIIFWIGKSICSGAKKLEFSIPSNKYLLSRVVGSRSRSIVTKAEHFSQFHFVGIRWFINYLIKAWFNGFGGKKRWLSFYFVFVLLHLKVFNQNRSIFLAIILFWLWGKPFLLVQIPSN